MNSDVLYVDVTIVGAGLVGLAAAVAMHQAGYSVVLIDSKNPSKVNHTDDAWDARIYAVSPKNAQWLGSLGVWQLLNIARVGEMQAMEIYGDATQAPVVLMASDANADNLGFVVESKALMQALLKQVESLGIGTLFDSACEAIKITDSNATLKLANQQIIESTLLLGADGSRSWVRQQLNIPIQQKSYEQTAIVANFNCERPHVHIARQWFSHDSEGKNSILAWLPLPDNTISIVWSVSTGLADTLLSLSDADFTKQVMAAGGTELGDLKLLGATAVYPLNLQKTDVFMQDCAVLVGDAAHQVHPMAGQGVNLGFRDVIDLIGVVKGKSRYQAINDSSLLKRYARLRKTDMLNMLVLTDGLYKLFASQNVAIKKVRNWGLSATNHQVIKKMLVANAIAF
ncbi:MAG: FAD-dependent monooxygenase [Methylotenera sp.]|nr:FAD-dependent monooxygenase [Methylotenera sp.]